MRTSAASRTSVTHRGIAKEVRRMCVAHRPRAPYGRGAPARPGGSGMCGVRRVRASVAAGGRAPPRPPRTRQSRAARTCWLRPACQRTGTTRWRAGPAPRTKPPVSPVLLGDPKSTLYIYRACAGSCRWRPQQQWRWAFPYPGELLLALCLSNPAQEPGSLMRCV